MRACDGLMAVTAAYTGMRWGELAGLAWKHVLLDAPTPLIKVDPKQGALHEVGGSLTLGTPKTPASVRPIHLPPFLVDLLRAWREQRHGPTVFPSPDGGYHRRCNFGVAPGCPPSAVTTCVGGTRS
ncbi:hypothetical protein [Alloactinosynnema sp. L-07]|nr:hypothetical protein [Alloactinosynnema sp. L-07]